MITTPVIHELSGPPSHDHSASRVPFVHQFPGWPGRPEELTVRSDEPIVQSLAIVTEGVVELVVGACDAPV
jgi:hypothetical protein